jgi:hypothetical protein
MEIAGLASRWPPAGPASRSAKKNFSRFKIQLISDLCQEFERRFTN